MDQEKLVRLSKIPDIVRFMEDVLTKKIDPQNITDNVLIKRGYAAMKMKRIPVDLVTNENLMMIKKMIDAREKTCSLCMYDSHDTENGQCQLCEETIEHVCSDCQREKYDICPMCDRLCCLNCMSISMCNSCDARTID